jgi:hypothetical protein
MLVVIRLKFILHLRYIERASITLQIYIIIIIIRLPRLGPDGMLRPHAGVFCVTLKIFVFFGW